MSNDIQKKFEELKKQANIEKIKLMGPFAVPLTTLAYYAISNTSIPASTNILCLIYTLVYSHFALNYDFTNLVMKEQGILKESKEYKELQDKYNLFLKEFTSFIKEYKLNDALTLNLLVSDLLSTGYFSYSGEFEYDYGLVNNKNKWMHEDTLLMGSRVFTDLGVCRHQAAFLTDVNNEYGYDSITLHIRGLKDNNPLLYLPIPRSLQPRFANHAATGVCTEKGKIVVDPTWETIAEFKNKKNAKIHSLKKDYDESYFIVNPWDSYTLHVNNFDVKKILEFENTDARIIDRDEYLTSHNEFSNILREDKTKFIEFRKKNLKLIKTISELHKAYIDMINGYKSEHLHLRRDDDPSWEYCDHTNYLTSKDFEEMFQNRL